MKSNNFIERSILSAATLLKDSIFAEEHAIKNGFLQSLDPRVKAVSFLLLIIKTLFTGSIAVLFFLYALCLILALASKINLGFFLKRTWIFIPLFSLFIALPAMFTGQLKGALIFLMRVTVCVSFTTLLSITTRHFALLKVLRIFRIPQIFVMILGICYRYVYLFAGIIQDTYLAIKSRVGSGIEYKRGQNIVAGNIACFWRHSVWLNEQVYQAMLSRGYQGEAVAWNDFKIKTRDWLWLVMVVLIIGVIKGL